jgi:hypothetical protein
MTTDDTPSSIARAVIGPTILLASAKLPQYIALLPYVLHSQIEPSDGSGLNAKLLCN